MRSRIMLRLQCFKTLSRPNLPQHCLKLCLSTGSTPTSEPSSAGKQHLGVMQIIKSFPQGMKLLAKDVQQYYNIQSASQSQHNSWTNKGGINYIPRRQSEQQRQLIRDLYKVAGPVAFVNIPILGNTIFLLIAWKPNFFLSKHFYNYQHHRRFVSEEYRSRRGAFESTANDFFSTIMMRSNSSQLRDQLCIQKGDNAGVFLDVLQLYKICQQINWKSIPKYQLVQLGEMLGMTRFYLNIIPDSVVLSHLKARVKDIVLDDGNLLKEKQHEKNCASLSDEEVLDACALRGLPCQLGQSYDDMRESLTNHLKMMKTVHDQVGKHTLITEISGVMFMLYLQPIRFKLSH